MPPVPAPSQSPPKPDQNTGQERGPAPERSLAQRMDALKRANDIRTRRAQLKRDLKAGREWKACHAEARDAAMEQLSLSNPFDAVELASNF